MGTKKYLIHPFVIVLALSLPGASFGRPIMPTLRALTRSADVIIVAQVEEVVTETSENTGNVWARRMATARVLEVWKGTAGERVQFRASKSWTCDASTAVVGETVILFLINAENPPVISIAYSGIGRLPVENDSVLLYGSLLTKEIKRLLRLTEETFKHRVQVDTLKEQVQHIAGRE